MSTTQDRLRQAARFTRLDADRELLTEAADALDRREAVIRLLEGEVALAAPGVPDDAKRLNWLDDTNKRFRMGWEVGQAPAGNVSIRTIITGGKSIRDAIDAAMLASRSQEGKA